MFLFGKMDLSTKGYIDGLNAFDPGGYGNHLAIYKS